MEEHSNEYEDGFFGLKKKSTRLDAVKFSGITEESTRKNENDSFEMEKNNCPACGGDAEKNSNKKKPHLQDLCAADREKIAQLVKKLAECTQKRKIAEAELAEMRFENETLISRYERRCSEHENETRILMEQLTTATSREKALKIESTRSLNTLGDQLDAQEKEFIKLTETVRDLLREKIQLQNALIERESRMKIAESKLERAKETLEMEKLLFIKEHAKDAILKKNRERGTQTNDGIEMKKNVHNFENSQTISAKIKSKDDLDDPSCDSILMRSLFFKPWNPGEEVHLSNVNFINCSTE